MYNSVTLPVENIIITRQFSNRKAQRIPQGKFQFVSFARDHINPPLPFLDALLFSYQFFSMWKGREFLECHYAGRKCCKIIVKNMLAIRRKIP